MKYKYKSVRVKQHGWGLLSSKNIPDLDNVLNREGTDGWRLCKYLMPSAAGGESDAVIITFEKIVE